MTHRTVDPYQHGDCLRNGVLKFPCTLFHESKISFVDQSGALQSVIGPLLLDVVVRQASQFVVNERQQFPQGFFIAIPPLE